MIDNFDPTVRAVIKFLQLLDVKVNAATINESLQNHPDWPSLVCITDTLSKWKLPNAAGNVDPNEIDELPTPFLAKVSDRESPLIIVLQVSETEVQLYEGAKKIIITKRRSDFIKEWNGVYIIAEPDLRSGEHEYDRNRNKILLSRIIPLTAIITTITLFFLLIGKRVNSLNSTDVSLSFGIYAQYTIFLLGSIVSILLTWHEIDQNNPLLKKVCSGLIKSNCNAILTSKQSKVFSWLSWSEVGLFFFMGNLFSLLFSGENITEAIWITSWMNILALPYTIFSVYYQNRIVKQWCLLCLSIQALLVGGGINIAAYRFLSISYAPKVSSILIAGLIHLLIIMLWFSVKPYILKSQRSKDDYRQYMRLKFNASVFDFLLKKQKQIYQSVEGLGINMGNPNASNTIIKVCHPYCGPCSKSYPEIEKLLESNDDLKIKIIFTFPGAELDYKYNPTPYFLALAKHAEPDELKNALNDWYLPVEKSFVRFAARYPISIDLLNQNEQLIAMDNWCRATSITHTPTFFINGFELPPAYGVEDLQYFLQDSLPTSQPL